MINTFDPAIAENYSRVFAHTAQNNVKQTQLHFSESEPQQQAVPISEPKHHMSIKQRLLRLTTSRHYA